MERLQKVLAIAGLGSRRACEELILQGRVVVDGKIVTKLGTKVDVDKQKISCDGEILRFPKKVYYAFNKPKNVICTNEEKQKEKTIVDFFKHLSFRVFAVGRLDKDSEGLILVTNDGDFAQRVLHPKYEIRKIYWVRVKGRVTNETLDKLNKGVWFKDGRMSFENAKILEIKDTYSVLEVEIHEGKNREVRRLLSRVDHEVKRLMRVQIGYLTIEDLAPGKYRALTDKDMELLFKRVKK